MEPIKKFDELVNIVKKESSRKLVVANGHDPHTIKATYKAARENLVDVIIVGDKDKVESLGSEYNLDVSIFEIIDNRDTKEAGRIARDMVKSGEADVLMKGLMASDVYMRLILDKKDGLLPRGNILSHVAVMEVSSYPKLLFVSDVAVLPLPDLFQKIQMLNYTIAVAHSFGIEKPKAAILAATEKVSVRMPATLDAATIAKMAERGQIKGAIVDGPLAFDIAINKEACEIKGFESPINGEADILIFPNIEAGNIFFKTITKLAGGSLAALVVGASAPCILTSRADSEDSKFYSIAMAALMGSKDV
ncbi:bifunctional enoyl-CoA hydratase/phosphate acetyltransferase [candidate division WOR-3 bacterium]|nr:bifunctional enoyl-CoA hydratase/phosphate acetyltransferase [candidate division WOR-3 bacterium]MCK4526663.1 bifunctional enoyl-CoA hydratase/phosphate acetyltransferase [candidate division WOR-3 bacterium]